MITIDTLLAAIDRFDYGAMPILADALEEAGDPRAAGMRLVVTARPLCLTGRRPWCWVWLVAERHSRAPLAVLPPGLFARLPGGHVIDSTFGAIHVSASHHDAFLALAEALSEDQP